MYVDETEQPTEESKCLLMDPEWTAEASATPGEVRTHIYAKASTALLAKPVASQASLPTWVPGASNKQQNSDLHHIRVAILEKITASYNSDSEGGAIRDNRVHVSR